VIGVCVGSWRGKCRVGGSGIFLKTVAAHIVLYLFEGRIVLDQFKNPFSRNDDAHANRNAKIIAFQISVGGQNRARLTIPCALIYPKKLLVAITRDAPTSGCAKTRYLRKLLDENW
jgi:hypothetical protein